MGKQKDIQSEPSESLPKGFKEGKCKCGNSYGYCGLDIGVCVKCLDNIETTDNHAKTYLKGITDGVECKKCGSYKYVLNEEEAEHWAKNHKCSQNKQNTSEGER